MIDDFNDNIIKQLSNSPVFTEFLQANSQSIPLILRNTIMDMYEEYNRSIVSEGQVSESAAEPFVPFTAPDTRFQDILTKHKLELHRLPSVDLKIYKETTVILAAAAAGRSLRKCKDMLEEAGVDVMICEFGLSAPDNARNNITECMSRAVSDIRGFIYFASGNTEGFIHRNSESVYNGRMLEMKHVLGCAQALHPAMTIDKEPIPFFGAVTFNALSEQNNDPFMAALHSQLNTLSLEYQKKAVVKGVDFYSEEWISPENLLAELTVNDGYWSVRYDEDKRSVYEWVYDNVYAARDVPAWEITQDTVMLAVGGGTGITAECIEETAKHSPCRIILAGRTGIGLESAYTHLLEMEASGPDLKKEIIKAAEKAGNEMSPAKCDDYHTKITRVRKIKETICALEETGSEVTYISCDVTQPGSVETLFEMIKFRYGRLDAIIYGAGIDRSKSLLNKDMESFEQVLKTKMLGIMNVMNNISLFPEMKKIVLFSSFYAWQGMQGSMDYTSGNRFLGECASCTPKEMHQLNITALYWGPWKSEGMAGSDYLEQYFSSYGLDMIEPERGKDIFLQALLANDKSIAVVPKNSKYNYSEWKGLLDDQDVLWANQYLQKHRNDYPFIDRIIEYIPGKSIKAIKKVSLDNDLYIHDHVFDGIPIVPGVIGTEIMAEAAKFLVPDKYIMSAENICLNRPFQVKNGNPVYIVVTGHVAEETNGTVSIHTALAEKTTSAEGKDESIDKDKFTAVIYFGAADDLKNRSVISGISNVSGLNINMPIDYAHDICKFADYKFGPLMTGQLQGIHSDQKRTYSDNYYNGHPLRYISGDLNYTANPFLIDICGQDKLKCFLWDYMIKVLPINIKLEWYAPAVSLNKFHTRAQVSSFDVKQNKAIIDGVILDEQDNPAISMNVEMYIRKYVENNSALFDSMIRDKRYGSLAVFLKEAELSLFAVDETMLDNLKENSLDPDGGEYLNLPHKQARLDWTASRLALKEIKNRIAEKLDIEASDITFEKDNNNRLMVKHNDILLKNVSISISHSSGWGFAGAVFNNELIGVDIETMEKRDESFFFQILNTGEYRIIEKYIEQVPVSKDDACTIIYSCKEALFKALNIKINMKDIVLQNIDMEGKAGFAVSINPAEAYTVYYYIFDKKVISVCKNTEATEDI